MYCTFKNLPAAQVDRSWNSFASPQGPQKPSPLLQESDDTLHPHHFGKGDALVFLSHKAHCVRPVTSGLRQTLVMELWEGEERREMVVGMVTAAHTHVVRRHMQGRYLTDFIGICMLYLQIFDFACTW